MGLTEWLVADEVLKRWGIREFELRNLVKAEGLPVFSNQNLARAMNPANVYTEKASLPNFADEALIARIGYRHISQCVFRRADILAFEEKWEIRPAPDEAAKGALEGDIRVQQALGGAVALALACERQMKETGQQMTRDKAKDFLQNERKLWTSENLFRLIWAAIPAELKKGPGRPLDP